MGGGDALNDLPDLDSSPPGADARIEPASDGSGDEAASDAPTRSELTPPAAAGGSGLDGALGNDLPTSVDTTPVVASAVPDSDPVERALAPPSLPPVPTLPPAPLTSGLLSSSRFGALVRPTPHVIERGTGFTGTTPARRSGRLLLGLVALAVFVVGAVVILAAFIGGQAPGASASPTVPVVAVASFTPTPTPAVTRAPRTPRPTPVRTPKPTPSPVPTPAPTSPPPTLPPTIAPTPSAVPATGSASTAAPVPTSVIPTVSPSPVVPSTTPSPSPTVVPTTVPTVIPSVVPSATPAGTPRVAQTYRVHKGDTLASIAKKFGVTRKQILAVNDLGDPPRLLYGTTINIPAP